MEKSSISAVETPLWRRIRPEEYLFVAFALALSLVVTFGRLGWGQLASQAAGKLRGYATFITSGAVVPVLGVAAVVALVLAWRAGRGPVTRLLRDAAPFLLAYFSYVLLRDLVPLIRPDLVDGRLAELEASVLGVPSFVAIPRALQCSTLDFLLMACYMSHYYVPPLVAIWLAWRHRERFRLFMLALTISWAVGYLGYIAVPAIGPKYYFGSHELWGTHEGLRPALGVIERFAGVSRDCFPSMHVAWTVLTLWIAWGARPFVAVYLPVAAGLTLATLYFGFHYLVDLPAGVLLALGSAWASRRLRDWWNRDDSAILRSCASARSASGSPSASA